MLYTVSKGKCLCSIQCIVIPTRIQRLDLSKKSTEYVRNIVTLEDLKPLIRRREKEERI